MLFGQRAVGVLRHQGTVHISTTLVPLSVIACDAVSYCSVRSAIDNYMMIRAVDGARGIPMCVLMYGYRTSRTSRTTQRKRGNHETRESDSADY